MRKERNLVFKEINELEKKKVEIVSLIKTKSKNVLQYIECGMTPQEVKSLIGNPRAVGDNSYGEMEWNYGNYWVIFESGVVSCIVKSKCYEKYYSCSYYSSNCKVK